MACLRFYVLVFCSVIVFSAQTAAQENKKPAVPTEDQIVSTEDRFRSLETFARAIYYLETMYVDPTKVKPDDVVSHALKGVIDHLDPHTILMPKRAFEQLSVDTQGKFGGIGIIVSQERGKLIIVSPIEDTPASRAGIKSGDEITAIDKVPLEKYKGSEAVDLMRGDPGSIIVLTVKRQGAKDLLEFKLAREIIKVKSVRGDNLAPGIVYARIASFQENTSDELTAFLKKEEQKGALKGVILDMRDNPGGLLDQAVRVSDLFLDSGIIVSTVGRDRDRVEREYAHKRGTFGNFPMVVLINGGSASASEIVAGAMQDHERSVIMGQTSFGKGSVQTLVSLPDGSGLKLTVARYFTPKDRSIQAKGIVPDIYVAAKKTATDEEKVDKKESDLKGHIEGKDLSNLSKESNIVKFVDTWPANLKQDHQLVTAFTYLKTWSIFQQGRPESEKPSKPEPVKPTSELVPPSK